MIKAALALLLACLITVNLKQLPPPVLYGLLCCLLVICLYFRQLFLLIFIGGLLWSGFQAQQRLDDQLSPQFQQPRLLISGRISSLPDQQTDRIRFLFTPDDPALPHKVTLSWYHNPQQPKAGEHWQLLVKLKPPHAFSNPGSFDYERWLFQQDIGASGYVRSSPDNKKLAGAASTDIQHWRQRIHDRLHHVLDEHPFRAFILGLTLGQRNELNNEHWQVLRQTGTSHLMAISGLHIGLVAIFLFFIGRWLWSRSTRLLLWLPARQAAAIFALSGALFYALLAGMSLPTQRALIMTATLLTGLLLKRRFFNINLLALSLILVLIADPFAVLSAGFWLSFSAVLLILLFTQYRHPSRPGQWLYVHLLLAAGMAPLTLLFFKQASLIGPLANTIAVPVVSFLIVPVSLLGTVLLWPFPELGQLLLQLADTLLSYLWSVLNYLSQLPVSSWQSADLPDWSLLSALLAILLLLSPRGLPARWLAIVFLLPALLFQPPHPADKHFELTVLDVGQGLSVVVQTARHVLVFDTGRYFSKRFNIGTAVVAPFLHSKNINIIDTLIISHNDIDHSGGMAGLLQNIPAKSILSSDTDFLPQSAACEHGQHWVWDGVRFDILNPVAGQNGNDNNRSCVLKVTSSTMSALIAADIERKSEQVLLNNMAEQLKADILVVPHHGSRSSSSQAFIDTVKPAYASFSLGYQNPYQFPAPEVLKRYRRAGSTIVRTDFSGAQIYRWQPRTGLQVDKWRELNQHLWSNRTTE